MKNIIVVLITFLNLSFLAQNRVVQDCGNETNHEQILSAAKTAQVMASCPATNNLFTFYAQNNGQRGVMFDLQAINPVTIQCFDVNLDAGTTNVEIYTKVGTHVGFQNTPGAWVLVGTAINLVAAGANLPTYVPVIVNIPIGAGNTQAFYITRTTAGGPIVDYTNGVLVGNLLAADANLRIFDGTGKDYPFGANFSPRQFNGRIYYNTGILPIELTKFEAIKQSESSNILKWTTATETNNDYFLVERSLDAINFVEVEKVKGAGNSMETLNYKLVDKKPYNGINYYRLKQVDFNGQFKYSNTVYSLNSVLEIKPVRVTNYLGQNVDENYEGLIFLFYPDGTVIKKVNN
jgi:hypothetical protein